MPGFPLRNENIWPRIAGAALVAALGLGAHSVAHADQFRLQNDTTDHAINFTIADRFDDCLSGLLDHNWFVLNPGETVFVDIDFEERFFIGATSLDLWGRSQTVTPFGRTDNNHNWVVPFDSSSMGACSIVLQPPTDGSNPTPFPHLELPGFLLCPATSEARAVNLPEGGVTFYVGCSDRPDQAPGGGDGGVGL
jgi:hypothetical protein